MMFESIPTYDKLRLQKETCLLGHAAAVQCGAMERAGVYARCLDEVDRRMAALVRPLYATQRREEMQALARAYKAHQVTPREYGLRAWRLRHGA